MDYLQDLDILFLEAGDGVTADLVIAGARAGTVDILPELNGKIISPFSGAIESAEPACVIRTADIAAKGIAHGVQLLFNDSAWYVVGIGPDEFGLTRLTLSVQGEL